MHLEYTPRRIVCLQPSATVILAAIGEIGWLVSCTKYCADVVPEVADSSRIILADSWTANAEQIIAARPDLVIAAVPYQESAVSEILKAGARFLGLAPRNLKDIYTDIATIAGVVGADSPATAGLAVPASPGPQRGDRSADDRCVRPAHRRLGPGAHRPRHPRPSRRG